MGLALALIFAYLAFANVDWARAWEVLKQVRASVLAIAVAALIVDYAIRVQRWKALLEAQGARTTYRACWHRFLASFALNNIMPLRIGDLYRIVSFREEAVAPPSTVTGTLIVERVADLGTVVMYFCAGLAFLPRASASRPLQRVALVALALLGLALIVTFLLPATLRSVAVWFLGFARIDRTGLGRSLKLFLEEVLLGLERYRSPRLLASLAATSLAIWTLEALVFACVGLALGISVAPAVAVLVMGAGTLATLLPSTPGYVGTFDYFTKLAMQETATPAVEAAAFTVAVHLVLWLPITLLGLISTFLLFGRDSLSAIGALRASALSE